MEGSELGFYKPAGWPAEGWRMMRRSPRLRPASAPGSAFTNMSASTEASAMARCGDFTGRPLDMWLTGVAARLHLHRPQQGYTFNLTFLETA